MMECAPSQPAPLDVARTKAPYVTEEGVRWRCSACAESIRRRAFVGRMRDMLIETMPRLEHLQLARR